MQIEAATDDVTEAVSFVRNRCDAMMVDPNRIVLGGFSAGATIAINSAFAESAPVAAVASLSGRMPIQSAETYVRDAQRPPLLMVFGENDLAGTLEDLEPRTCHFGEVGSEHEVVHSRRHALLSPDIPSAPQGRPQDRFRKSAGRFSVQASQARRADRVVITLCIRRTIASFHQWPLLAQSGQSVTRVP
jgi:dienelactone hydrolase